MSFVLTLLTDDPELARRADEAGIDRIGLDLERLGKVERQAGTDSRMSDHSLRSLPALRAVVRTAKLFVRTNPLHAALRAEVDACIEAGARVLMLPMVGSAADAAAFVAHVEGRADVSLLVETRAAVDRIDDIAGVAGVHEIHVGLNDLRLSLGLRSHFAVLASDMLERVSAVVRGAGLRFGVGGVGRYLDATLPIPADLVYAQYPRLLADRAWVARSFLGPRPSRIDLPREVATLRARLDYWRAQPQEVLLEARDRLRSLIPQNMG